MEVYLICFGLTLACAWINEKLLEHNDKGALTWISAALVILIPSILAGCRDYHIGTDVYVYAKATFEKILELGFSGVYLKQDSLLSVMEPGFKLLAYITSLFSSSPNAFLFSIALVIGGAVYFSLYNLRCSCSIFMGEFIYLFACYNETYNMMRQCMAMACVLLAMSFFLRKKYWPIFPVILVGIGFHFTAVLSIPILILTYIMELDIYFGKDEKFSRWTKLLILAIALLLILFSFRPVCASLLHNGILPVKYAQYVAAENSFKIGWKEFFRYIFPYVFLFLHNNKLKYVNVFFAMALCDIVFYPLRSQVLWLARISTYFFYVKILSFAEFKIDTGRIFGEKIITLDDMITLCMVITMVYYWYFYSIAGNLNETYPYTSKILGIYL